MLSIRWKILLLAATILILAFSLLACIAGLNDKEADQFMYALLEARDEADSTMVIDQILESGDTRFISVFIEMMRAGQIGLFPNALHLTTQYSEALETLSGQDFGYYWADWVEWYGNTDLEPPPGFIGWKGNLFSRIDSGFADFLYDNAVSLIRVEEILWGGVRVDGIPALDNAKMLPASQADYLTPEEPIFGIFLNGDARAYPLRIMDWHEMANDVVGGVPVSLSYCTLCGAAIAYDGRASNGQAYTFGSSGLLYRSNKLMYDRQTRTIWNQFTGEPVLGELAGKDVELSLIPVVLTSWQAWHEQHPETLVLDIETGYDRVYVPGAAYGSYFSSDETMFPVAERSALLDTKDQIYAINIDGVPKAYPIDTLAEELVVNDMVGDTPVALVATRGTVEVEGLSLRQRRTVIYTAGSEVRVYQRGDETFHPGPDTDTVLDEAGQSWQITEDALVGPAGERAPRLGGHLSYWFGWYAFFPNTEVYGQ